ncbi:acyl-CoA N-acyltransferase [Artomyces pyxidatus]|uniref:Acyl-CoA N-acyltransferase n=1 Tax=Artomyces pyxidatus TaxID=48021 RepID=A0ACB8T1R0_9AGAM|nr:acyl-CoA N-acyltransferase [Artomyces pyxidatus]
MSISKIQVRHVQTFTEKDVQQVIDIWSQAYRDDEFIRTTTRGIPELFEKFIHATFIAAMRGGEIYFATHEDNTVAGVAAWYPPGRLAFDSPEQAEGGYNELFDRHPELVDWWMDFLPKFSTEALGEGFKLASWHLMFIGVRPELQRHGVGRALIEHVKQIAEREGKALCVEAGTEDTIAFYQDCGFFIRGSQVDWKNPTQNLPTWVLSTKI